MCSAFASKTFAQQNLVPNPSFEEYTDCPQEVGEFSKVEKWKNFRGSPDYYNTCSDTFASVPCNRLSCQVASSGNAYGGLFGLNFNNSYREIVGVQLSEPLIIGQTYYVSFKTSAVYGGYYGIFWFSNKLGIKFSTQEYSENNPVPINNFAHIYSEDIISDTSNWTTIQGTFIADAAYSHVMIGNFYDNQNTDTLAVINISLGAYYYVDDVCVTTNPSGCSFTSNLSNTANDQFVVYPNPVSERFYIEHTYHGMPNILMYDITSRLVPISVKHKIALTEIDVSHLQSGLYYLRIESQGFTTTKEVVVHH